MVYNNTCDYLKFNNKREDVVSGSSTLYTSNHMISLWKNSIDNTHSVDMIFLHIFEEKEV